MGELKIIRNFYKHCNSIKGFSYFRERPTHVGTAAIYIRRDPTQSPL